MIFWGVGDILKKKKRWEDGEWEKQIPLGISHGVLEPQVL